MKIKHEITSLTFSLLRTYVSPLIPSVIDQNDSDPSHLIQLPKITYINMSLTEDECFCLRCTWLLKEMGDDTGLIWFSPITKQASMGELQHFVKHYYVGM